jgi:cardiolipin synthase
MAPAAPFAPFALPHAAPESLTCLELLARYARRPEYYQLADAARLLVNGHETFAAMLAAIAGASSSVELGTYTIQADGVGRQFQAALISAAARGVQVRLLYDFIGSRGLPAAFVNALLAAGVAVAVYHPPIFGRICQTINRRNHRKLLIVDRRLLFAGGLNLTDAYAAPADHGDGWRDTHTALTGTAVASAGARLYEHDWQHATPYPETIPRLAWWPSGVRRRLRRILTIRQLWRHATDELQRAIHQGHVPVQVIGNEALRHRHAIHQAYLYAIHHARHYILIENAYFIPTRAIRKALAQAVSRGVQVAVTVPRHSDVPIVTHASRYLYARLLAQGIRIYEWPHAMLHAKTAVIDDAWSVVGSYNLDRRSLFHQLEVVVTVLDRDFATRLREQTLADLAQCHEVTCHAHAQRSWRRRLLETLAYAFRYWL